MGCRVKVTEDGVPVQDVIAAIKRAIKEANVSAADEDRDLKIGPVRLVLHALATRTVGGGLRFTVPFIGMPVKFGTRLTRSDTHEIEISLAPPEQAAREVVREAYLDLALVDSIETIRAVVASAAGGDDPFILNDAKITLSFALTAEGDISIGAEGSMSNEVTHSLILNVVPA
jgi:Trypsin-co-occurring domain 2